MKINKEDYNKLKQLDRIEYIVLSEKIKNKVDISYSIYFSLFTILTTGLMAILFKLYPNTIPKILIILWLYIYMIITLTSWFLNLITAFKALKELNNLNNEYFKIEVKK